MGQQPASACRVGSTKTHRQGANSSVVVNILSFSCSSEAQLTSTANLVEGMSNVAYVDAVALLGTDLPDLQAAVLNPESIAELALKHNNSSNTAGKAHANVSFRQRYAASLSKSSTVLVSVSQCEPSPGSATAASSLHQGSGSASLTLQSYIAAVERTAFLHLRHACWAILLVWQSLPPPEAYLCSCTWYLFRIFRRQAHCSQ